MGSAHWFYRAKRFARQWLITLETIVSFNDLRNSLHLVRLHRACAVPDTMWKYPCQVMSIGIMLYFRLACCNPAASTPLIVLCWLPECCVDFPDAVLLPLFESSMGTAYLCDLEAALTRKGSHKYKSNNHL